MLGGAYPTGNCVSCKTLKFRPCPYPGIKPGLEKTGEFETVGTKGTGDDDLCVGPVGGGMGSGIYWHDRDLRDASARGGATSTTPSKSPTISAPISIGLMLALRLVLRPPLSVRLFTQLSRDTISQQTNFCENGF